jgi:hypothetical protein
MKKFGKGHISGASSEHVASAKNAMSQKDNGSMDYMRIQDKFASEDASKLRKGEYRHNRYE